MRKYLMLCIEIEETAARIYRQLAKSGRLPNELQVILQSMAAEEDDHATQLRFALRFPANTAFIDKQYDRAQAQSLLSRAKNLLEKTCQQESDVKQAIEMGIELEDDFCQVHIGNSMQFRDENLKKMFAALAQDDKVHSQKLLNAKLRFL